MDRIRSTTFALAALFFVGMPTGTLADNTSIGQIFALGDHVLPGETMTISGGQLEPGDRLSFRLSIGSTDLALGEAVVAADGTIELQAVIPADSPVGYAAVTATDGKGGTWNANVLIGERPEGPGASTAPAPAASDGPIGDRAIGLLMAAFGVVVLLVAIAWYWTGRRQKAPTKD